MHEPLASVVIGGTTIAPGLILVILTGVLLFFVGRSESGGLIWVILALILGVLLAAAFPQIAYDINSFFRHFS